MANPKSYAHKRLVFNLIKHGRLSCVVCDKPVQADDSPDIRIILIDNTQPRVVTNMALRHRLCERSKYRPSINPQDMVKLVETMIASKYKLCVVCGQSWANIEEFEHLALVEKDGVLEVVHLVCLPRSERA